MHGCTHLSRFALVSRVFPGRNAKKYTGHCIIACVPMWCGRRDLNPHAIRQRNLNPSSLPIPPRPHVVGGGERSIRSAMRRCGHPSTRGGACQSPFSAAYVSSNHWQRQDRTKSALAAIWHGRKGTAKHGPLWAGSAG